MEEKTLQRKKSFTKINAKKVKIKEMKRIILVKKELNVTEVMSRMLSDKYINIGLRIIDLCARNNFSREKKSEIN